MAASFLTELTTLGNFSLHGVTENTTFPYVMGNVTDDVINMTTTTAAPVRQPAPAPLTGLVDAATKDLVVEVVNCYFLPVVFLFGVCGNIMSFVVLIIHGLNNSTNVLLLGVTVSDFCYLITMFSRKVSCIVSKFDFLESRRLETGLLPTMYMVNRVFGLTTPFLTMVITLERCLAVSMPFKVQQIVTPTRMKLIVLSVFLFACAAISPFFFIYEVKYYPDRTTGEMVPRLAGTPFYYENYDVITAYNNIALSGIFYFGPMIVVVICTVFILTTIRKSSQWRKNQAQGSVSSEERRMTKLLVAIAIVYVCLYIPGAMIGIANQATSDFGSLGGRYNNLFYLVAALQLLLYASNSSCNFFLYMVFSNKFYNTYGRIFLCRKEGGRDKIKSAGDKTKQAETAVTTSGIASSSVCDSSVTEPPSSEKEN